MRSYSLLLSLFLLCLSVPRSLHAQALSVETHYHTVQGLKAAELKSALHDLMQPETVLHYGGGEGATWSGFAVVDVMPDGSVRDRYSNVQRSFNGSASVQGMNIEHIWANSWWGHTVNNAYRDLFNLYPADGEANLSKSNNPIGVVDGNVAYDNGVTRVGKSTSYRADSLITVWEPADTWKGDFARTYFYMATMYAHMSSEWQTSDGLLTVDTASWQTIRPWVSQLMLQWADEDPVDDIERQRNDGIALIQGNRNPFVDYPQLAGYIWGDAQEQAFYLTPEATDPELFVPQADVTIDFGLQALSRTAQRSVTVRGRNLPDGIEASLEGEGFRMPDHTLTAAEVTAGVRLPIESSVTAAGDYLATLVLRSGDTFEQRVPLAMIVIDGIPAYEGRNIVCNVSNKAFTASWMNMGLGEEETYTLSVYKKDASGERQLLSKFPVTTTDTTYVINGLKASTTYYYQVTARDGQLTSNEVQVDMPAVTPVFTVSPSQMAFLALPGEASGAQEVKVTALEVPQYIASVTCPAPFEVSTDGQEWGSELTLKGSKPTFQVRLSAVEAGDYEGEMIVACPDVREVVVTLTASVDASKAFFETFEIGSKIGYKAAEVTCNAATWLMEDALIAADANSNDKKSVRIKSGGAMTMTTDKEGGCDSLWFYAGLYGSDKGVLLTVTYSQDAGVTWTPVVSDLSFNQGEWQRYAYAIEREGNIRLRFAAQGGDKKNPPRLNIDDIQMSSYTAATGLTAPGMAADLPPRVFTLDGRYVGTALPQRPGLYIIRKGNTMHKVLITQ